MLTNLCAANSVDCADQIIGVVSKNSIFHRDRHMEHAWPSPRLSRGAHQSPGVARPNFLPHMIQRHQATMSDLPAPRSENTSCNSIVHD